MSAFDTTAELMRGDLGKAVQQLERESGKGLFMGGVRLPLAPRFGHTLRRIPGELAEAVRKRVGAKGLSGFVARALAHELEREGVSARPGELEQQLGPPSKAGLARAKYGRSADSRLGDGQCFGTTDREAGAR